MTYNPNRALLRLCLSLLMLLGLIACAAALPLLVAGAVLRRRYLKGRMAQG